MAGNVWEWCVDGFGEYTAEPVSNPAGPERPRTGCSAAAVGRTAPRFCRSAYRNAFGPADRSGTWAFAWPQFRSQFQEPEPGTSGAWTQAEG